MYNKYGISPLATPSMDGNSAPSSSYGNRFTPRSFAYNGRVAAALLPSLAVVASYGGFQVAASLVVGFMGAYILDGMRFKEGAFTAVWATLGVAHLALAYNTIIVGGELTLGLALLALLLSALTLFLIGVWATLQFKWVQLQYPAVAVALEKMLIVGCLPVGATMQAWGIALSAGMHSTPFFLACLLCALYYLFGRPLFSSFTSRPHRRAATGGASGAAPRLQGRTDGVTAFLLTAALPAAVYAATHAANIFQWVHLWSLLLLGAGPTLFVIGVKDGTWWLGNSASADALRSLTLLLALAAFLAGVEGRIIFQSFGQYIRLAAPWSYIAITMALYGSGALGLLYASGSLGEEALSTALGPVLMVSASVGGLVMGLPAWVLPGPLLASSGLALFFDSRSFRDYLIFVGGAVATGVWFLWRHFWFLKDVTLDGLPLRTLCVLLGVAMLPAFIVPGLISLGAKHSLIAWPLTLQAALLCFVEERLYAGDHAQVTYNVHEMYPAFLVIATSVLGLAMARRLEASATIRPPESYLLQCIFGAKAAMLLVPEARLTMPVLGVVLAVTPPLLLSRSNGGSGSGRVSSAEQQYHLIPSQHSRALLPWQGLALAAAVVTSVLAARYAVFDILNLLLNRRPSEALATGSLLLAAATGCLPLVSTYYRTSAQAKRALLLTAAAGLLLALLRPPLPVAGGAECPRMPFGLCPRLWNADHAPQHEQDDVAVYGDGLRRREHWPLWLLVGAAFSGLVATTSPAPARAVAPLRLGEAALSGALVAGYLALEFFPDMALVQTAVAASALLAAAAAVLLQMATKGATLLLPLLGVAWAVCFPAAWLAQAVSSLPPLPPEAVRLLPDLSESLEVEEEREAAVRAAILATFAAEALLLAFALKLKVAAIARGAHRGGMAARHHSSDSFAAVDRAAEFLGQCLPQAQTFASSASKPFLRGPVTAQGQRLAAEGLSWAPFACNLVTMLCFVLCLVLNSAFTEGSPWGVVLFSPLLLLLCQDPLVARGLTDERRYFPPLAVTAAVLLGSAACEAGASLLFDDFFRLVSEEGLELAIDMGLAAATLPALALTLRALWRGGAGGAGPGQAAVAAVLAAAGVGLAHMDAVRVCAGVAAVGGVWLATQGQQARRSAQKLI